MEYKIGFMQGRLSPLQGKKIQSFPWKNWKNEFQIGKRLNFKILEWTLDFIKLYSNPLMTKEGQKKIKSLCSKYNFKVLSLTGDCFMQKPFWKINSLKRISLQMDFLNIVEASGKIGIKFIVLPLVDNGRVESQKQEMILINFLRNIYPLLRLNKIKILFETDFKPKKYFKFIKNFNRKFFGINYDTGNSASYGFNPSEEISLYGKYIDNVHIKDRIYKGNTVPLGEGNADFLTIFKKLKQISYKGNFILQGARSKKNQHVPIIKEYRDFVTKFLMNS
mgnify:CR=1 FL=1|jgi:hexulose-6-phosphate isomerase|tara:strand:+ start:6145 stop:6978 length:834 start_codon:yes stop_codon:yes gene_type:complete